MAWTFSQTGVRSGRLFRIVLLAAVLAAVLAMGATPARAQKDRVVLALKWRHQFQFAGYYAAAFTGAYDRAGLDVEIVPGRPDTVVREVLSGRADFGVSGSDLILARQKGKPVVALAAIFQHAAEVMLVRPDSGILSPQDMVGHPIMLGNEVAAAPYLAMFLQEGMDPASLDIIPQSYTLDDFIQGHVDAMSAYVTDQPHRLDRLDVPYNMIRPITYGIDFYGDCLFTSEREIERRPERVRAFVKASLEGWQYALDHPETVIDYLDRKYDVLRYGIDREQLGYEAKKTRDLIRPDLVEIGHQNPGRWRHIAETFVDLGMAASVPDLDRFIYNPEPPGVTWSHWSVKAVFAVLGGLALVALALLLFNRRLQREVSARQDAARALKQSRDELDRILASITDGFFVLDPDLVVTYFNRAAEKLLRTPAAEVVGRPLFEVFSEARGSVFERRYTWAVREKQPAEFETFFEPHAQWYKARVFPMEQGGISVFFTITTAEKAAQEAILARERKYRRKYSRGLSPHTVYLLIHG